MSDYFVAKRKAVARYDIPATLAREIGRFLVTWAHFEHYIQAVIWNTLEVPAEIGRIAVREERVTDRLDMLCELCEVKNYAVDFVLLKEIRKKANSLASNRHLLAHSFWQKHDADNVWCAVLTRGSWADLQIDIPGYPVGQSKRIEPEAIPITTDEIREWREQTVSLIDDLKKIGDQHRPVPSPERRNGQLKHQSQSPDPTGSKRARQRQSSRQRRDAAMSRENQK